jgi:hypothetical protein
MSDEAASSNSGGESASGGPESGVGPGQPEGAPKGNGSATETAVSPADQWLANKRKVKVNGAEREVSAQEAFDAYQLKQASYEMFEKANNMKKESETRDQQLLHALKSNPVEVLSKLFGPQQARQLMESEVTKALEWDMLKPEQRERMTLQQERAEFERQRKEYETERRNDHNQRQAVALQGQYKQSFPAALQAAGLDPSEGNVREMAAVARRMVDAGVKWTPEMAASALAEIHQERTHSFMNQRKSKLSGLSEEQLHALMSSEYGDEILNKFRKADVARLRMGKQNEGQQPQQPQERTRSSEGKFMSVDNLRDELERRRG